MLGVKWVHSWDFDVADWTSASIGKNKFLWLVAAKSVVAPDHFVCHWYNVPTTHNNFISYVERHKFKATLQVSTGTKQNGAICYWVMAIARSILLMHLTVLSDMETRLFFVIENLTRHYGFGYQSAIYSALRWEEIDQFYCLEHNLYSQ